ncbi:AAA family ATPase [Mycolicibacterium fortuitum]|jgi:5-methylcytosine-specific restriction protein B|uniref:AAA family ATPase n=1 Tax=Mycolicibacterium fortuitum TaxID=1766 RepID=UPI003AAB90BD
MTKANEGELVSEGTLPPDDFHDCIPRIIEVAGEELEVPEDLLAKLQAIAASELLVEPELLYGCAAALTTGNLILEGPPGTGKSSLARQLANAFGVDLYAATAHEDWSTFEVIGRQELRAQPSVPGGPLVEQIVPVNGYFTESVIRCAGQISKHWDDEAEPQAEWLLIDELNRAHPDRAFGELFSVIGTDELVEVVLNHQSAENDRFVVPRRFRIIATINTYDRQFVNTLSQALRRRFTFLTVGVPDRRPAGELWGEGASVAAREFTVVLAKAAATAERRLGYGEGMLGGHLANGAAHELAVEVFELVEHIRYAEAVSELPYIPVGTACLIDVMTAFLVRWAQTDFDIADAAASMDWAVCAKLVPLFEVDIVNRQKLLQLADRMPQTFGRLTHRRIREISSDGAYFVP